VRLEVFEKRFDDFVDLYTQNHADVVKHLDKIDERLGSIETSIWQGYRLIEHERIIRELAERTGNADLAVPIQPPLGTAKPVIS
jgi:hypothetical protein